MADEQLSALGRIRGDELAGDPAKDDAVHIAEAPLTSDERERVLAAVFARLDARHAGPAKVLTSPRSRSGAMLVAALAVAAALVLLFARPGEELAPLPSFSITRSEGGIAAVRSDAGAGPLRLRSPSDAIEVVITPGVPVHGELAVVVVARADGVAPRIATITDRVERSPNGAVRIRGPLDRFIALERGTWRIEWWVSHAGAEPRSIDALTDVEAAHVATEAIIASD